jgi:choline dehydrogenase-like flavoprotein
MWAETVNDSSYSFDQVWPYYQRSTRFTSPNVEKRLANATALYNASAFNPADGPLEVSYSNFAMPFSTWMEQGMQGIGMREAPDFNSGELFGYQYCTSTIRPQDQSRSTSESSFLQGPTPNLRVYTKTLAKQILFDDNKNAIGIEVSDSRHVRANKGVIVSAGVFQSPQLLMVSGIGPRSHLQEHNIPVLSDLPGVGQGMLDHPFFAPSYRVGVETLTRVATHPLHLASEYLRWATTSDGIFANPVADFLGWEKIPAELRAGFSEDTRQILSRFTEDWPEVEVLLDYFILNDEIMLTSTVYLRSRIYRQCFQPLQGPTQRWLRICFYPRSSHFHDIPWYRHPSVCRHIRPTYHKPKLACHGVRSAIGSGVVQENPPSFCER